MWPYATVETALVLIQVETISAHVVTIHRDALVKVTNGRVGQVAAFLVQPPDGPMTHLVLRRDQWGRTKALTIPISEIAQIGKEAVSLKLDKRSLTLPSIPMHCEGL